MALATSSPNIALTNAWVLVAENVARCAITLESATKAIIFVGASAPAGGTTAGHTLSALYRSFNLDELVDGEKVYARALSTSASIAVTKG